MIEEKEEIWRDISGYEGLYQVSNLGRVKSIEHNVKSKNGSIRTVSEKILNPSKSKNGYFRVILYKDSKTKHIQLHRLVAQAFIQNDSIFNNQVNHKNECKTDNRSCNLEWCDAKYNMNYGTRNERISKTKKGVYNTKKSKPVICVETCKVYQSIGEVQRLLGFSNGSISECCNENESKRMDITGNM